MRSMDSTWVPITFHTQIINKNCLFIGNYREFNRENDDGAPYVFFVSHLTVRVSHCFSFQWNVFFTFAIYTCTYTFVGVCFLVGVYTIDVIFVELIVYVQESEY